MSQPKNWLEIWPRNSERQMQMSFNAEITTQRNRNQLFGLRREAERHAAMETLFTVEKRCRRFALPPQSKIFAAHEDQSPTSAQIYRRHER
jgi:hypothetical protein